MLKKIIIFSILASLLSACSTGPSGFFKRSANNKIFDRTGFKGGKRAPLYNKKYISQAKKNVVTGEYEDDDFADLENEDSEAENTSKDNVDMYKSMIKHDISLDGNDKKHTKSKNSNGFPSLIRGKQQANYDDQQNMELKKELSQIKTMLKETQKEVANNRCPGAALSSDAIDSKGKAGLPSVKRAEPAPTLRKEKQAPKPITNDKKTILLEPVESL